MKRAVRPIRFSPGAPSSCAVAWRILPTLTLALLLAGPAQVRAAHLSWDFENGDAQSCEDFNAFVLVGTFGLLHEGRMAMQDSISSWFDHDSTSLTQPAPAKPAETKAARPVSTPTRSSISAATVATKPAAIKTAETAPPSAVQRVLIAHEKVLVSVHNAVWKALPKPWELLPKTNPPRPAANAKGTDGSSAPQSK